MSLAVQRSTAATRSSSSLLSQGSRGPEVVALQRALAAAGFSPGAVDGDFGPRTRAAVIAFQRARGLVADGVVGPRTRAALGTAPSAPAPSPGQALLRFGARGGSVVALQQALARAGFSPGGADGVFGSRTQTAVLAFQRARGLAVDGIVGPATWRALGSSDVFDAGPVGPGSSNAARLAYAKRRAVQIGLRITSTTGGNHVAGSYHYQGRAVDVAGPASLMAQFYREMARLSPTECFYDPCGGIKYGRSIGAIGGHRDHVHVAF